ncbi:MAG: hypothetical protein PF961_04595 [Planctomycetota bacterium]|jgi:hypothetical protein|nr:hypothetical protein [Planctomycetota bacterium]
MPFDLSRHPLFSPWTDPFSSVTSYLLTKRVAPVQYSLPSPYGGISKDERWLWLACVHPPNPQPSLALVHLDPADPWIRHFPQFGFSGSAPLVAPEGDAVYLASRRHVYHCTANGEHEAVCTLPGDYVAGRQLWRLSSFLSPSADGRYLLLDGLVGHHSFVALGDLASGQVQVVREFQAHHGNAQFSPSNSTELIIAQLAQRDPFTGIHIEAGLRLHRMRLDGRGYRCLTPSIPHERGSGLRFEWWTQAGAVAYVDRGNGAWTIDPDTGKHRILWRGDFDHVDLCHRQRYLCGDGPAERWRDKGNAVSFADSRNGACIQVDSGMLPPPYPRRELPLSPYPRFSPQSSWLAYTSTRGGGVDLALCPRRDLEEQLHRLPALEAEVETSEENGEIAEAGSGAWRAWGD